MAIRVKTCALRPASTPTEKPAKHIGVPMRIASSVLGACLNDIELEGEDVLEDVEGNSMAIRAPNRFVASAEAWLKRQRQARVESRRDQSCVKWRKRKGGSQSEMTGRGGGTVCPRSTQGHLL